MKALKYALILGITFTSIACVSENSKSQLKAKLESTAGSTPTVSGDDKVRSIEAFKQTVYPMVTTMSCVQCHGDTKLYQPYYAVSDANAAWQTILIDSKKVNLENPETSRIYLRIKNDHHNCLTGAGDTNCDSEAAAMLAAIVKWKDLVKSTTTTTSGIKTSAIYYKDLTLTDPDVEYGTLLMEAEQPEFPQAMVGRFVTEADGLASSFSYALTPGAPANPVTRATRTTVFAKGNACEVTTAAQLSDSINGPFQIREQGTHINSGTRTPETNLLIKDGHRPFHIPINAAIIRPDKRMAYAKMLTGWSGGVASGVPAITNIQALTIADRNFDTGDLKLGSTTRDNPNAIDITDRSLTGMMYNDVSFRTLPYFTPRDSVFNALDSSFINEPTNKILNLEGNQIDLKNLFKLPQNDITARDVLKFFEKNDNDPAIPNKFRKDLVFKYIKENLDAIANSTIPYRSIRSMSANHLYSLYGNLKINITACPNGTCTSTTQAVEITPGTDADGVPLTYANALDILKVNAAGTGFVAGTTAELNAGKAFRRIDVYAHFNVVPNPPAYGMAFDQKFYNFNGSTFDLKSTVTFPINVPDINLNLKALYSSGATPTVSKGDSLTNFQTTLHPVLKNATCMSCHSGSQANRVQFASSNPLIAFNEIQRTNLVNFTTPANSFRRVFFPVESRIVHNCGTAAECSALQNEMVNAINQWKSANDADIPAAPITPFEDLTAAQRTPGMLEYKFNVKKTGLYNVWTKVKALANNRINLRIMDGATPIKVMTNIVNPVASANSCIGYTFDEYTDWRWFTPNRRNELANLSATGKLKKNAQGQLLPIVDGRTYWPLEAGKNYTLQIFEANSLTKIDMIAVDYVANLNDTLDFQPDLLARDENNIADYRKRVLSYDISNLVGLPPASAYFKVEVKTALGDQNYIFRNPRIISPNANIAVQGIKVYINGATAFTDATWSNLNLTAGDGQIMTFASLLALIPQSPATDHFQFSFDKISKTTATISELDPRGTAPILIEGRKCRELDLFLNTVKPILRNARLMLKTDNGINDYLNRFPGSNRDESRAPQMYQCMGCHNDTHPYFKMTTFDYPEILCAQALSRVDFSNYRDSLLVRGLDGSGVHPKLHFIEELQYDSGTTTVVPYDENNGTRILGGQIKNQVNAASPAYFSKWITGYYFNTYSQADLGLSATWSANSDAKKALARSHMGQFKRIKYAKLPDLSTYPFYETFVHDRLKDQVQSELDDLVTGVFNERTFNLYTPYIPTAPETEGAMGNRPIDLNVVKDGTKIRTANGKKVFNTTQSEEDMNNKLEDLKTNYRNVILNWISKEHDHIKNGN